MDSETTSSVESQNSLVKEKLFVSGKLDIHKDLEKSQKRPIEQLSGKRKKLYIFSTKQT
jgi:hypothetical protein